MSDRAVRFGLNDGLHGVVSTPEHSFNEELPVIIILNSGLLHKVGPFRLSVNLARKLAIVGYRVLRFDISGIGDSRMRISKSGEDFSVADVQSAMNYLDESFGVGRCYVLIGLCSGADNSHRTSLVDTRVVGSVHLDGYGYRNAAYYLHYYGARLLSSELMRKKIKMKFSDNKKLTQQEVSWAYDRAFPPIDQAIEEFSKLFLRGVKMLYIYTGGVEDYYNHKGQLQQLLKGIDVKDNLDEEFYREADHTYSRVNNREKVVQRILGWLDVRFK